MEFTLTHEVTPDELVSLLAEALAARTTTGEVAAPKMEAGKTSQEGEATVVPIRRQRVRGISDETPDQQEVIRVLAENFSDEELDNWTDEQEARLWDLLVAELTKLPIALAASILEEQLTTIPVEERDDYLPGYSEYLVHREAARKAHATRARNGWVHPRSRANSRTA